MVLFSNLDCKKASLPRRVRASLSALGLACTVPRDSELAYLSRILDFLLLLLLLLLPATGAAQQGVLYLLWRLLFVLIRQREFEKTIAVPYWSHAEWSPNPPKPLSNSYKK
jgi:hypothetical protein